MRQVIRKHRPISRLYRITHRQLKVLNLEKVSRTRRINTMYEYCGGQYTRQEAVRYGGIGVGGLKYINGAEKVDEIKRKGALRSNIETLKDGIAFYLRDDEGNYLLLIHDSELLSISFDKEVDHIIRRDKFSLFNACISKGMPYHYSKMMLMEDEMTQLHPVRLKIITKNLDEINFECVRKNPLKIKEYFLNSPFRSLFVEDYNTFQYIL